MIEKLEVPSFGQLEMTDDGVEIVTMESKEAVIQDLVKKVNEIIDVFNITSDK